MTLHSKHHSWICSLLIRATALAIALPAGATPEGSSWNLRGVAKPICLLLLAFDATSQPGAGQGPPPLALPPPPTLPPALVSGAEAALYGLVAQSLNHTLVRANATGTLPSLDEIKNMLGASTPQIESVLEALLVSYDPSAPGDLQRPWALPASWPNLTLSGSPSEAMLAELANIASAQLLEASFIQDAIAFQLWTVYDAVASQNPQGSIGFAIAAHELLSVASAVGAASFQATAVAAQHRLNDLINKDSQDAPPANASQIQTGESIPSLDSPEVWPALLYGTWKFTKWEPRGSITFQFGPEKFVKINSTFASDGAETIQTDYIFAPIEYTISMRQTRQPDGTLVPSHDAEVTMTSHGKVMAFTLFCPNPSHLDSSLIVLFEQGGERLSFMKTPDA